MPSDRPVVFLAFADARGDLPSLKAEGWSIRDQFDELRRRGVIDGLEVEERASLERIYAVFRKNPGRVAIFHFGGHAAGDRLLLDSELGPRESFAPGLAAFLGQQEGLKLVFLNGCSTRPQVKQLLEAGVPAVIATARPIRDRTATAFAVAFYQALTSGYTGPNPRVVGGCNLERAFGQAASIARAMAGGTARDLVASAPAVDDVTDDDGFPWRFSHRPGSDHVRRWGLFDVDPLFGLPGLPADVDWPAEPYRNLAYFKREHARIFFGRGRAIRAMYDELVNPAGARLVFFLGQTGVGKSSLLDAGVLPRVETLFEPRYARRDAEAGLLGTLRAELAPLAGDFDLGAAWLESERRAGKPLLVVLDQAEEAFTRRRAGQRAGEEVGELFEAVRRAFARTRADRPAGRLILGFRKEWAADFDERRKASGLDVRSILLDPLSLDSVLEAIEGPAEHFGLAIRPGRDDLKPGEATLAEFIAHDLFDTLADPQSEQESPVAPTLQILLSRMWQEAHDPARFGGRPVFDRKLYQDLKAKGFKLDEVLRAQFAEIAEVDGLRDAVEKGLLLDLLDFFTTRDGTAEARTRREVRERYPPIPLGRTEALLDDMLEACQGRHLLAHVKGGSDDSAAYRLTHDTLAPLIRERFRASADPAQHARHLLEGRAATWKGREADPVLDRADLASVDAGLPWMRAPDEAERALLLASRRAEELRLAEERDRQRKLGESEALRKRATAFALRATLIGLGASLVLLGVAGWQWYEATVQAGIATEKTQKAKESAREAEAQTEIARMQARIAESRRLAAAADTVRPERLDLALLLALEAWGLSDDSEARASFQRAIDERPEVAGFRHLPGLAITSIAYGPDGTLAVAARSNSKLGGLLVLFDKAGCRPNPEPFAIDQGDLTALAFAPDGTLAAVVSNPGGVGSGVVRFDRAGHRLAPGLLTVEGGIVSGLSIGPDGTLALGLKTEFGIGVGVVLLDKRGKRLTPDPLKVEQGVASDVAFGPGGTLAAIIRDRSGNGVGVARFDGAGHLLPPGMLSLQEGIVTRFAIGLAYGPDGTLAVGLGNGMNQGGVTFFDATGKRLATELLEDAEGRVSGVAFGPDGTLAAGFGRDDGAGDVALFDVGRKRLAGGSRVVKEGHVSGVAFAPDGTLAASFVSEREEGGVIVFDGREHRLAIERLVVDEGDVNGLAYGPGGTLAAGFSAGPGKAGGVVRFGKDRRRVPDGPLAIEEGPVDAVSYAPDGTLAAGFHKVDGGGIVLFDPTGRRSTPEPLTFGDGWPFWDLAFGPDGTLAACFSRPGAVMRFDKTGKRLDPAALKVEGVVYTVAFGPDGTLAAGVDNDDGVGEGELVRFDRAGKRRDAAPLAVNEGGVNLVAYGPDGTLAAAFNRGPSPAMPDGVVRFDPAGEPMAPGPLAVREGWISGLAYGPDGTLAAGVLGGEGGGGVILFDRGGRRLAPNPLRIKERIVKGLAFAPDGTLAAGFGTLDGFRGGVVIFDADPASWRRKAGLVANRNITWAEWTRYFPDTPYRRTVRSLPWPVDLPAEQLERARASEAGTTPKGGPP